MEVGKDYPFHTYNSQTPGDLRITWKAYKQTAVSTCNHIRRVGRVSGFVSDTFLCGVSLGGHLGTWLSDMHAELVLLVHKLSLEKIWT